MHRSEPQLTFPSTQGFTRLFNHISIALFVGLTFLNLDNSLLSLQYRVFAIFFVTVRLTLLESLRLLDLTIPLFPQVLPAIVISQVEPTFIMGVRPAQPRDESPKLIRF